MQATPPESISSNAFHWIIGRLNQRKIPFRITGGLAAQCYGAKRPLADIDLDFPEDRYNEILDVVRPYVHFGPATYKDSSWELELLTLNYQGQEIDLGGCCTRIFDHSKKIWIESVTDLSSCETKNIFGLDVPVIPKLELIAYKTILAREVDLEDIRQISN